MKTLLFCLLLSFQLQGQTIFKTITRDNYKYQTGYFTDNKLDSVWVMYNINGDTISVAHYNLGIKHGIWMWKQDSLIHKLYYEQGQKRKYEIYNKNNLLTKKDL